MLTCGGVIADSEFAFWEIETLLVSTTPRTQHYPVRNSTINLLGLAWTNCHCSAAATEAVAAGLLHRKGALDIGGCLGPQYAGVSPASREPHRSIPRHAPLVAKINDAMVPKSQNLLAQSCHRCWPPDR